MLLTFTLFGWTLCCRLCSRCNFVQKLYTFFNASPHCWDILLNELREKRLPVVKRLCDTRWSAHSAATSALKKSYENIRASLVSISNNAYEEAATKQEAIGPQKKMDQLENCILLELWETVLEQKCRSGS